MSKVLKTWFERVWCGTCESKPNLRREKIQMDDGRLKIVREKCWMCEGDQQREKRRK